jgi:peptidoglycan hydrolase-like protein with peptidoglycan-binding domain
LLLMLGTSSANTASTAQHATVKKASSSHKSKGKVRKTRSRAWKRHGQQGMDSQRVRQIQTALIRERYLNGEPTGVWDQRSKQAMTRYQADNGWQAKVTPDSRALIKLGLGPDHADLINPDTAVLQSGGGAEKPQPQIPQNQLPPNKQ